MFVEIVFQREPTFQLYFACLYRNPHDRCHDGRTGQGKGYICGKSGAVVREKQTPTHCHATQGKARRSRSRSRIFMFGTCKLYQWKQYSYRWRCRGIRLWVINTVEPTILLIHKEAIYAKKA